MIALRMRRQIETSSGFIIDRRDFGVPRSQRGVRKISPEVFFGPMSLMGTPYSTAATRTPTRFRSPSQRFAARRSSSVRFD